MRNIIYIFFLSVSLSTGCGSPESPPRIEIITAQGQEIGNLLNIVNEDDLRWIRENVGSLDGLVNLTESEIEAGYKAILNLKTINDVKFSGPTPSNFIEYKSQRFEKYLRLLVDKKYEFQAVGIEKNGKKIILFNLGVNIIGKKVWNSKPVFHKVYDGGVGFVRIQYDVAVGVIVDWDCNGEA